MNFSALMHACRVGACGPGKDPSPIIIPAGWMQGRTTFGGLTAALSLEVVLLNHPGLAPLRSAQVAFIGPVAGSASVTTTVLREGRSVTYVGADLISEGKLAARSLFAFGASRPSTFDHRFLPAPDLPGPEHSALYFREFGAPEFSNHFEVRLARGAHPISGAREHDHCLWVRHRDPEAHSISALLALADMPPPAALPMFTAPAPISSMTWQANLMAAVPVTRDGWWLFETRAENVAEGYSSQDMFIWSRDGQPMVAGRQCVAVFA